MSTRLDIFERRKLLIAVVLAASLPAWGQATHQQDQTLHGIPLGPDDLLSLSVSGSTDLTNTFRIDSHGLLELPLLERAVEAKGLFPEQLAARIAEELKTGKIMVRPVVHVSVLEYGDRSVTVIGAVRHPLTFQATGADTMLDALARAGGLSPEAGPEALLTRNGTEVVHVPLHRLLTDPLSQYNYRLKGGEQIRVPEYGHVYVIGRVRWPGEFPLRYSEQSTVLKTLAQAGGTLSFAKEAAVIYRLDTRSLRVREIELPLKNILKHKVADMILQPGDIIYIPEASGRRLTLETISRILGPATLVGADWFIDRR